MASYIRTSDHLTILFDDGDSVTVYPTNGQYKNIIAALNAKDYELVRTLSTPVRVIETSLSDGDDGSTCEVRDGVVIYNGKPMHNTLTERMLQMLDDGFDVEPMKKFLVNLQENPSFRAVNELYRFLEKGNLPITDDGHFVAYKKVDHNYKDCHTHTIDNSVGQVVTMARNLVDEDKSRECSQGLHFCARDYLSNFSGSHIMMVKINPRDVVAIPEDYNSSKGRCCRYEVIGELSDEDKLEGAYRDTRPITSTWEDEYEELDEGDEEDDLDYEFDRWQRDYGYNADNDNLPPDTVAEEDLVQASPFPSGRIDEENSAFAGIPTEEPVAVPAEVVTEIQAEVNEVEGTEMRVPGYPDPFIVYPGQTLTVQDRKIEVNRVLRGDRKTARGLTFKYQDRPNVVITDDQTLPSSQLHQENGTLKGGLPHA